MKTMITCAAALAVAGSVLAQSGGPTIIQQPADRALCAGSQTSFTVQAGGAGVTPTAFQWQVETAPGEWRQLPLVELPPGVWVRVSTFVDESTSSSTLFFAWIGTPDSGRYRCLVSGPFGSTASDAARLTVLSADLGSAGGVGVPDDHYDNNDFVSFIAAFFAGRPAADLGSAGGLAGGDGSFDNNDFIAFIDLFFNGCVELH